MIAPHIRAQADTPVPAGLWKAEWITSPDALAQTAGVWHFRRVLDLSSKPEHMLVHVSADNQFLLFVNDARVGTGPSHSDLQHWPYETYDLAPLLHPGRNTLAATVWNFGGDTPVRQISSRTGFLLQAVGEDHAAVNTGSSWEVERETGLSTLPKPAEFARTYYVASPGEAIDATKFDWSWAADPASQGTSQWHNAVALGHASSRGTAFAENDWQLVPDSLPQMEMVSQPAGRVVRQAGVTDATPFPDGPVTIAPHTQATLLLDATHLTTAFPELSIAGGAGASLKLTYAEALYDSKEQKGNRNDISGKHIEGVYDTFLSDGGDSRTFTPLDWRTWRYLQIDIATADKPLRLDRLRTWFTAYPFRQMARFESGDKSLQLIWDIGWRTARMDAHDTYMDTPYWERLQYTGDTRIQALISYTVAGDDRLARQAIEAFHNSTISDGITLSRYPASGFQSIPGFSLFWIGMVHDFYIYRDDPEFVKAQLPVVRSTLEWFQRHENPNGLLGKLPWWSFVDWTGDFESGVPPQDAQGDSAILTLQWVEALRNAADIESTLGDSHLSELDRSIADRAAAAVKDLCWSDQYGLIADTPEKKHFSQQANAFAVWLDVIPTSRQRVAMTNILSITDSPFKAEGPVPALSPASYYFRFYLARALVHAGLGGRYLQSLGPWHTMVENGLTTWAEQPEPTRSDSHAWSAHPNYDLLTTVAGIAPGEPGFRRIHIEPHLGALQSLSVAVPHPVGEIRAQFLTKGDHVKAKITLPAGVAGEIIWNGESHPLGPGEQEVILPGSRSEATSDGTESGHQRNN